VSPQVPGRKSPPAARQACSSAKDQLPLKSARELQQQCRVLGGVAATAHTAPTTLPSKPRQFPRVVWKSLPSRRQHTLSWPASQRANQASWCARQRFETSVSQSLGSAAFAQKVFA
jgi:Ser/Thr protein kinase RdoA (MazF antagonist)